MKKKLVSLMLVAAMAATMVTGCGSNNGNKDASDNNGSTTEESKDDSQEESKDDSQAASGDGAVYYLNFKPEQADQWKALAETYTEQTGVPVTVETAASGTYESTLKSEMAKEEAPTLFQVNGPVGLASWADYCYDLKDSALYKNLKSDDFALIADYAVGVWQSGQRLRVVSLLAPGGSGRSNSVDSPGLAASLSTC